MEAAADHIAADNEALKDMESITLTLGPVYDDFMEMSGNRPGPAVREVGRTL